MIKINTKIYNNSPLIVKSNQGLTRKKYFNEYNTVFDFMHSHDPSAY